MKKNLTLVALILTFTHLTTKGQVQDFRELLGLNINSDIVQTYFKSLAPNPEMYEQRDYQFKKNGMEFNTKNDTIVAIFIMSKNYYEGYWPYVGFIPYNLSFNDTRKIVEQKLGPADYVSEGSPPNQYGKGWDMSCNWNSPDIRINFKTDFRNIMNSKIGFIAFYKFKKKKI